MELIERLEALSAERQREHDKCPADKKSLGEELCPRCGAGPSGPCWKKYQADHHFATEVIAALKATHTGEGHD